MADRQVEVFVEGDGTVLRASCGPTVAATESQRPSPTSPSIDYLLGVRYDRRQGAQPRCPRSSPARHRQSSGRPPGRSRRGSALPARFQPMKPHSRNIERSGRIEPLGVRVRFLEGGLEEEEGPGSEHPFLSRFGYPLLGFCRRSQRLEDGLAVDRLDLFPALLVE